MSVCKHFSFSFAIGIVILTVQTRAGSDAGIAAITNPSADVTLSFVQPGRVAEVHVKEGPIDGSVEKIEAETGESVNALESVVRIVQIDPLWIDVPEPLVRASTLACEGTVEVRFPDPDKMSVEGKIVFIAAVADASSATLRVRVEVSNKAKRPAGEHVTVVFPTSQEKRRASENESLSASPLSKSQPQLSSARAIHRHRYIKA